MQLCQQEVLQMTMSKRETLDTASDVLTDDQLELVSGGGVTPDAGGNIPTCPPWFPGRPPFPLRTL
jgi:hypothetical protein